MLFKNNNTLRVLHILIWKHLKERVRRFGHSIMEIVTGVLVFALLLLVKQIVVDSNKSIEKFVGDIDTIDLLFVPKNHLSESLLNDICTETFEDHSNLIGLHIKCYGFQKEEEANFFVNNIKFQDSEAVILIVFEEFNGVRFPKDFRYSIKFVGPESNRITKFEPIRYHHDPLLIEKNATFFANVQWEIDKSYMRMLIGENIDHVVAFHSVKELTSPEMREIHSLLALCTVLAPLPFFLGTNAALADEKRSGIKALLKLNSVQPTLIYVAHLIDTTIFISIYAVLIVTFLHITSTPILKFSNPFIIWTMFMLHSLTITAVTFVTSTLSQNYQHSDSMAVLFYLMTFLINLLWLGHGFGTSFWLTITYFFLPHAPVFMFWNDVVAAEATGEGTTFKNLHKGHSTTDVSCVLMVWFVFFVQLILTLLLSWYLDKVKPGSYGVALPWHFIFHKRFWRQVCWKRKKRIGVSFHVTAEKITKKLKYLRDARYFEPKEKGTKVTINIAEVTKVFKRRNSEYTAVDHVSMEVFERAITIILGTSGAGKTCLVSIITGMSSATDGHVYINGLDIESRLHDLRSDLSYCPQHDLTFDYLTVKENLVFFQFIRDLTRKQNIGEQIDAEHLLKTFQLEDKATFYSKELPPGLRKCLQVACALIGQADVLVFDDPSHGMDAPMKHRLWDALLTLRKSKTILMTTSCMIEANALGDRIALLQRGKIKCFASPAFLKNAIGSNMEVSLRLSGKIPVEIVEEVLYRIMKQSKVEEDFSISAVENTRVIINLPTQKRDHFPDVFDLLESKRKQLEILAMSVGVSMEQVFLRFMETDDIDPIMEMDDDTPEDELLKGNQLKKYQLKLLIKRCWVYVFNHKYQFIFVQVLVPLLAFIVITLACNTSRVYKRDDHDRPSLFKYIETKLFFTPKAHYRRSGVIQLQNKYRYVEFIASENIQKDIIEFNNEYHQRSEIVPKYILGMISDYHRTDIYFPISSAAVLPTAVNIIGNELLYRHVPRSLGNSIDTTIEPNAAQTHFVEPKRMYLCYCWAMWVTFLVIIPLGPLIRLCLEEYNSGARFSHCLMGCKPTVIWLSKLIAHMAIYLAIVPWSILFVAFFLDKDETINDFDFLGSLLLLLIVFGPAHLLHWYVLSFVLSMKRPIVKMYNVSLCLGLISPVIVFFLSEIYSHWPVALLVFLYILYVLANFIPTFTFSVGLAKICKVARNNAFCKLNYHLCPNDMVEDIWVPKTVCCSSGGTPFKYYTNYYNGLWELIILLLHWIFHWMLLMMLQRRTIQPIMNKLLRKLCLCAKKSKPFKNPNKCLSVKAEQAIVQAKVERLRLMRPADRQNQPEALLVENLYKSYIKACRTPVHAVKGVSFAVKQGECLALLGKNASGKTSTLSIVAGFTATSRGVINVNGYFLKEDRTQYLQNIAWCTGGGMDAFLTGLENVQLLAALFGHSKSFALKIAMRYLQYMGLIRYSNILFESYSPSAAHRLAVCSALVSSPRAALLEELCAHVDPHTRPYVTRAVQSLLAKNVAVVLTEQSLEWRQIDDCCTRLAIMDKGEIVSIGTVADIRRQFATGHTVLIKLKVDKTYQLAEDTEAVSVISGKSMVQSSRVADLKADFTKMFESSLIVDEHISMLYFYIKDPERKLTYSFMFKNMEGLMKKYDMIEDYILTEASIDDILCRVSEQLHGDVEQRKTSLKILTLE